MAAARWRAAEQLITAIVDQVLPACWDDEGGLEGIIPGELTGTVKVCLDGVGYVKRNYAAAKAQRGSL